MMKQKYYPILGVVAILSVVLISGCVTKECETASDCANKTCFTVDCKDNKCVYSSISDCCGNKMCEVNETYSTCVADCPNCDDKNNCTVDEYDYHQQKCVNTPILDVVCCGNGVCEIGEVYLNCSRDCPNCDDKNECTKDSYDYHKQKCVNEAIIPCCGNGICDKGAETHLNCSKDCPNCDDGNKLTTDSFNYETQKCENPVTHYFIDDFEGAIKSWVFSGEGNWSTAVEGSNTYLKLTGYQQANLWKNWTDYAFKFRFKRVEGSMHVNFRHSSTKEGWNRYLVGISTQVNNIEKQEIDFGFDNALWHTFEIRCYGDTINVYMDNELLTKYKDTENVLLSGGVGFETHTGGAPITPEFLIDDVEIKIITEKDVIYP